jgi:hypothetical protein
MPPDLAPRLPFESTANGPSRSDGTVVAIGKQQLRVTPVFDAYWQFAAERQAAQTFPAQADYVFADYQQLPSKYFRPGRLEFGVEL